MIKKYFQKAGGVNLLKKYWRAGVLHTAIVQFLLLGRSETALRLLRRIVSMKIQEKLKKKYKKVLEEFDKQYVEKEHVVSRKVWMFWWQGMDYAPALVQRCYDSVKEHLSDWEIILITKDNYKEYASFPNYILQKLENGQITLTHFSDLLRLELLINHGGLWLDATVLCTSGDIPKSILNSDLFFYSPQKPGADGCAIKMSSWAIYAKTNNRILMGTQYLLYHYWQKHNRLIVYFLLHHFFSYVIEYYYKDYKKVPPFCNSTPHILLLHLFDEYDELYWNDLQKMTCFHKLTYKFEKTDSEKKGTYYDVLMRNL